MTTNAGFTAHDQGAAKLWHAAFQQRVYRVLLEAFSYPGRTLPLPPGANPPVLALTATLVDAGVTLADPDGLLRGDDRSRLGACMGRPEKAHFIVTDGARAPSFAPSLGTLDAPDLGATLVLQVASLREGRRLDLAGPGIARAASLSVWGLHPAWIDTRSDWNSAFPLGVDWLLCDDRHVAALPRTTRITGKEMPWAM